jgi:hypothetical protein
MACVSIISVCIAGGSLIDERIVRNDSGCVVGCVLKADQKKMKHCFEIKCSCIIIYNISWRNNLPNFSI